MKVKDIIVGLRFALLKLNRGHLEEAQKEFAFHIDQMVKGLQSSDEELVDIKERIASAIFDYEAEGYVRPHDADCHELADIIMARLKIV